MKEDERKFIMENLKDVDYTYVMNPLINGDDTQLISSTMQEESI